MPPLAISLGVTTILSPIRVALGWLNPLCMQTRPPVGAQLWCGVVAGADANSSRIDRNFPRLGGTTWKSAAPLLSVISVRIGGGEDILYPV